MRENGFVVPDPKLNADKTIKWVNIKQSIDDLSKNRTRSLNLDKGLRKEDDVEQQDKFLEYAKCLRANGIDVDDPTFGDSVRESMKTVLLEIENKNKRPYKAMSLCKDQIYGNKK